MAFLSIRHHITMATDDLRVANRAHQPKRFVFPRRSFGTKGRKRAFNPAWLDKWSWLITLFVFTAHVRIEGTFYQMVSAGSMKKRRFYQLEGCLCEIFNIYYYILIMVIRYLKLDYKHAKFLKT